MSSRGRSSLKRLITEKGAVGYGNFADSHTAPLSYVHTLYLEVNVIGVEIVDFVEQNVDLLHPKPVKYTVG